MTLYRLTVHAVLGYLIVAIWVKCATSTMANTEYLTSILKVYSLFSDRRRNAQSIYTASIVPLMTY